MNQKHKTNKTPPNSFAEIISAKEKVLNEAKEKLKKDFIGLDKIIDQIIESIKSWYIFPELQIRPSIICLWGLTGVGKTDLVRKLVSYLQMQEKFLEIEINESAQESKTIQARLDDSSISSEESCILFLDEFQKFRTVNEKGLTNSENKGYSDVWSILSDGRFSSDLNKKTEFLNDFLQEKYYREIYSESSGKSVKEKAERDAKRIYKTNIYLARKLKKFFKLEKTIEEVMKFSEDDISNLYNTLTNDVYEGEIYKKMLIIVSGNLDEAYKIAQNVDEVDLDANWYHEYSKKINILDIKKALLERFRPEQIARLGNTHILYPSLSRENYYEIIRLKCSQISDLVNEKYNISISFDKTIYETIYKNGVFPTQGVRPLLSTTTNILSYILSVFVYECLIKGVSFLSVESKNDVICGKIKENIISVPIPTVLETLKKEIDQDSKHIIAVHELGHAVAYAVIFNVTPAQICTDAIGFRAAGFILKHETWETKETMMKNMIVGMAGRAAEEIVFGERNITVGAEKDIAQVTENARNYVGKYGFDGFVGNITSNCAEPSDSKIFSAEKINDITEILIMEAKEGAKNLLHTNLAFFRESLSELLKRGKLSPQEFQKIAESFGIKIKDVSEKDSIILGYKEMTEKFLS